MHENSCKVAGGSKIPQRTVGQSIFKFEKKKTLLDEKWNLRSFLTIKELRQSIKKKTQVVTRLKIVQIHLKTMESRGQLFVIFAGENSDQSQLSKFKN